MKLLSLATLHFKKLGTQTFEFKDGLNLIAGDNAQGKSTLLEAIKMALFGVAAMPCAKGEIPTWGQTKCSSTLEFTLTGEERYVLTRTLTTAKLIKVTEQDGEILEANGHTPVTARIEELTGLTVKDWELFVQSSQGFATGILTFGATALNKKVEEFAGVDLIDKVQTLAARYAQRADAQAEVQVVPAERIEAWNQEVSAAQADYDTAEQAANKALAALDSVGPAPTPPTGPTAADLRAGQRVVDTANSRVDAVEQELESAKERAADAVNALGTKTLIDLTALDAQLASKLERGETLKATIDQLNAQVKTLESAKQGLDSGRAALDAAKLRMDKENEGDTNEQLNEQLTEARSAHEDATQKVAQLNVKVGEAQAAYENLKKLAKGATCPTCKRAMEDHNPEQLAKDCEEAEKALAAARAQLTDQQQSLAVYQPVITNLTQTLSNRAHYTNLHNLQVEALVTLQATFDEVSGLYSDSAQKAEQASAERDTVREEYSTLREQRRTSNGHNTDVTNLISLVEQAKERVTRKQAEFDADLAHLESLEDCATDEQVKAAEEMEAAFLEARHAHQHAVSQAENSLSMARQALTAATGRADRANASLKEALASNELAAANYDLAKKYDRLTRFLRERRQTYLKEVWDAVMAASSRMVRRSSSDVITRVDNREGSFYFEEAGNMAPTSSASGAQKALIGTSIRVGLARALYGSDALMIFDEPTEGCTEFNASNMVAQLATSARQVLLITHREGDQALANHIINVGQ